MSIIQTYADATTDYENAIQDVRRTKKPWTDAAKALVGHRFDISEALESLGDDAPKSEPVVDSYDLRRLLDMYPHVAEMCREVE